MTNALSCYARDKLPPCSLFLLILKIVPTFFPLPPPDESLDRVTRTKINKSCSLLEVSFVFSKKGKKKVSLSFEKRGLIITSCHVTPRGEGDSFVAIIWNKSNDANASSLGEEINRVYRQSYIAWLIARVPNFYYHLQPVQRLYYYIIWIIVLADKL